MNKRLKFRDYFFREMRERRKFHDYLGTGIIAALLWFLVGNYFYSEPINHPANHTVGYAVVSFLGIVSYGLIKMLITSSIHKRKGSKFAVR